MDQPGIEDIGKSPASSASRTAFIPVKDWARRSPGPDDIERGRVVAQELKHLHAKDVLIRAAAAGYVSERRCRMTFCFCPLGDTEFLPRAGTQLGPWIPTHEHYPTAARKKGTRRLDNVVLAHRRCNNVGHKLEALYESLDALQLDPRAIRIAIDDHVAQRRTRNGLYPRKRGSWKRAREIAQKAHEDLQADGDR